MSHGFSWKFHVISHRHKSTRREFGPNPHQIPWRFYVIYPRYICFPCWNMTWILNKLGSWNFHGICEENDGISRADLVSFPNQTKLPSKRYEKIHVTFVSGKYPKTFNFNFCICYLFRSKEVEGTQFKQNSKLLRIVMTKNMELEFINALEKTSNGHILDFFYNKLNN